MAALRERISCNRNPSLQICPPRIFGTRPTPARCRRKCPPAIFHCLANRLRKKKYHLHIRSKALQYFHPTMQFSAVLHIFHKHSSRFRDPDWNTAAQNNRSPDNSLPQRSIHTALSYSSLPATSSCPMICPYPTGSTKP